MTSFKHELLGRRGFSLIPPYGLHAIISTNSRLLLPTKFVVTHEKGWYLYAGKYPTGWEKKVKVVNLPAPAKKGSMSRFTKPKSTKRGDDSSETCFDIIPYEGCLPPIGNIVLEGSPPPSTSTHSSRRPIVGKPRPSTSRTSMDDYPSSKRKTSPPPPSTTTKRKGVLAEAPIRSLRPSPVDESAQTDRVGEFIPILAKTPTPHKGVTSTGASQIGSTSPATPSVISASDPFVALSQAVKDGSSLVVTLSSIPSFTTRGLDTDLMPTTPTSTTPIAPISTILGIFLFSISSLIFIMDSSSHLAYP
ncbi:hypothetical protein SO802_012852 [Lithocarpus litseifolius]|uniref:Uncharacterized protein n=1 Tax=Lithocarpus litseifolius TaxID=425828 RepID=A0AAW2D4N2_9ROSI